MAKIIGKKLKMSQIWKGDKVIPVTVIKVQAKEEVLEGLRFGDRVDVVSVSKGKGFQGVVKRHGFHGGPKSHGQKDRLRAPGSIGATAPQRVVKGRKMAGHMGNRKLTIKNLSVAEVRPEENLIMLKGAVPGMRGTTIELTTNN